jgi:hypothetical protein
LVTHIFQKTVQKGLRRFRAKPSFITSTNLQSVQARALPGKLHPHSHFAPAAGFTLFFRSFGDHSFGSKHKAREEILSQWVGSDESALFLGPTEFGDDDDFVDCSADWDMLRNYHHTGHDFGFGETISCVGFHAYRG